MLDMVDGAVVLDVNVQPVRDEITSYHHSRLDDTVLLREILLAEVLGNRVSRTYRIIPERDYTNRLAVSVVRDGLPHQLGSPLRSLVLRVIGDTWYDERHFAG